MSPTATRIGIAASIVGAVGALAYIVRGSPSGPQGVPGSPGSPGVPGQSSVSTSAGAAPTAGGCGCGGSACPNADSPITFVGGAGGCMSSSPETLAASIARCKPGYSQSVMQSSIDNLRAADLAQANSTYQAILARSAPDAFYDPLFTPNSVYGAA